MNVWIKFAALGSWTFGCILMFPTGDRFGVGVFLAGFGLWALLTDSAIEAHMDARTK